jgi:predicted transcriptional regulator
MNNMNELPSEANGLLALAGRIVAAYVSNNAVSAGDVPTVVRSIYATLSGLASGGQTETGTSAKPAVPIKKSLTADYLICLEDGKRLKMLKRYLRSRYQLTPDDYRRKWGLPADYPMVAPNYAAKRSEFAKKIGLGRRHAVGRKRKR